MPFAQGATDSFVLELPQGIHNFGATLPDTFMVALYTGDATLVASTTAYTTTGEVSATGYTAGGSVLTLVNPVSTDGVTYWSFSDVSWTAALTARGALIYNATESNRSVAVLDFGSDKTSTTTFTLTFPAVTSTSAILRARANTD